jgi:hypothetical protein
VDWDRVSVYTIRIKSLSDLSLSLLDEQTDIGPRLRDTVTAQASVAHVFPGLKRLSWTYSDDWQWAIPVMLTPSISGFELDDEGATALVSR